MPNKTKSQLMAEMNELRQQIDSLKAETIQNRQVEAALVEERNLLRTLIDNMPDYIYVKDIHSRFVIKNEYSIKAMGAKSVEEILGKTDFDFYPPDMAAGFHADDRQVMESGQPLLAHEEMVLEQGQLRWVLTNKAPLKDRNGRVVGVVGIGRDVTERKRMEESLRESEQRLALALTGADLGLWDVDVLTGRDTVNARAAQMIGYTLDEVEPNIQWWDTRTHPADLGRIHTAWEAHLTGQTPFYECEYRLQTKTGEWIWVLDRGQVVERDAVGQPLRLAGTHLNITERKQAEENLHRSNRELAFLNRVSLAFNSSLEFDQVLTHILEEVRPLLGVVGTSIWLIDRLTRELVCQQASGLHNEMLQHWRLPPDTGIVGWCIAHNQSAIVIEAQSDPRHYKGVEEQTKLKIQSVLAVPLKTKHDIIGALEVVDTTPNRFTLADLTLMESLAATAATAIDNARLYEQSRLDGETKAVLLREVNHRVKNNLASIISLLYLEQTHPGKEDDATYQSILQDLINRIHGLSTVHRMLSASVWQPLRLSDLASGIIESALRVLPQDKRVEVEVTPSAIQIPPKLANTMALIINELATNALKYAWRDRQQGCIKVWIDYDSEQVCFEFRDDGVGFPPTMLTSKQGNVGWDLIHSLVSQSLRGEVKLFNQNGAVTVIRFPTTL
jgi:PAS domain S-box-containing protein